MYRKHSLVAALVAVAVVAGLAPVASARIKLATLPVRERVEIQLENENATLVETALSRYPAADAYALTLFAYGCDRPMALPLATDDDPAFGSE